MPEKILAFRVDVIGVSQESQEIAKLDQQLRNLNKTQKSIIKARDQGNISRAKSEKLLAQLASKTTDLKTKKQQLLKVDKLQTQQFQAAAGSVNKLQIQMTQLRNRMNNVNLTTKAGQKEWARLNAQYERGTAALRRYNGRLSGSARLQAAFSKGILASTAQMAKGFLGLTAVIKVFRDLTKVTGDFDTATAKLASIAGKTREEISDLTEEAKLLGSTTIFTASQVTDLQIELSKLGFVKEDIQNATRAILDFAAATDADLGQAAKVAGVAVRAFGLDTLETADAVSTLAVATTKSALAFEDYETILSTVGPVAKTYGFTLENTVALTGRLRDAGFDASKAATATRNILLNLADANGDLAKSLGGSVGTFDELIDGMITLDERGVDLATTLELTDKRSVAAFNQFLAGAESIRTLNGDITDVNESLETMVQQRLDSYAGDVKGLASAWEGLILSFKASGVIREGVQFLTNALLQVQNLDLAVRKFHKQSQEQLSRSYDLLDRLTNKQGERFDFVVDWFDAMDNVEVQSSEMYQSIVDSFQSIRKVNRKEAVALADEYLRRREEEAQKEVEIEAAKQERIAEDAVAQQKKGAAAQQKVSDEQREKDLKAEQEHTKALIEENRFRIASIKALQKIADQDYSSAVKNLESSFDLWLDLQEDQLQKEVTAQLDAWDREADAYEDNKSRELQIAMDIEAAKEDIRNAAVDLVYSGMDAVFAFQQANMKKELEAAGDNEEKKAEIQREYAKKEQSLAIVQSLINTAVAVTKALTGAPPPFNFILAGIVGAAGALQTAAISAEKFKEGGVVKPGSELPGSTKGTDNTLALVTPGEVILNKKQQKVMGGPSAFRKAGVPGFAAGGVVKRPSPNTSTIDQQVSLETAFSTLKVIQNVNELNEAQAELAVINENSGL